MLLLPEQGWVGGEVRPGVAVRVEGDRITWIGDRAQAYSAFPEEERILLPNRLLLPGFVNAHSHAFQRALRGHVQHADGPDSFWSWRERMYALAERLTPEEVERLSTLAFREMVEAGFTSVGEFHYLQHQPDGAPYPDPDALALAVHRAAANAGIRLVLLRVAYARPGYQRPPNPRQARFYDPSPHAVLDAIARLRARGVDAHLAVHSVRAVPRDWMEALAAFDGVIHAHVDEQPGEIEESLAEHGLRPLEVFAAAGLLSPRFSAVHLTHPSDHEIALLAAAGGRVVACPTTELDLGDGFLPSERLGEIPVAIGTDSHALIDPFAEIRALEWHARARLGRRNVLSPPGQPDGLAARLLASGSAAGAGALGLEAGEIAVGKLADLLTIDLTQTALQEARLLPAVVFCGGPSAVKEVWVGGTQVKGGGA